MMLARLDLLSIHPLTVQSLLPPLLHRTSARTHQVTPCIIAHAEETFAHKSGKTVLLSLNTSRDATSLLQGNNVFFVTVFDFYMWPYNHTTRKFKVVSKKNAYG